MDEERVDREIQSTKSMLVSNIKFKMKNYTGLFKKKTVWYEEKVERQSFAENILAGLLINAPTCAQESGSHVKSQNEKYKITNTQNTKYKV